ncbi:ABC transporter permease [Roseivirga sp.]|uniref:ABC transporter permease n=1 Tax=Roseivirga sp. TaxID=1964215 RepID=UPI003B8C1015
MLKNYIKIAFRSLRRNSGYAIINIIGLAIGITGATLLLTYVKDEATYDQFHSRSEDIFRAILTEHDLEEDRVYAASQPILARTVVEELPEVENATALQVTGGHIDFVIGGERYSERSYAIVDEHFFEVFDFEFLFGNKATALSEPNSIVLSEQQAMKFFGKTDVVGTTLKHSFGGNYIITGVIKNMPGNSHLRLDILATPMSSDQRLLQMQKNWMHFQASVYYVLAPKSDPAQVTNKINEVFESNIAPNIAEVIDFDLQKMSDIHFGSQGIANGFETELGDRSYIIVFSSIALFLLLIASVNYMNLATSKAVFRAKEVGIRKVVGAVKGQLVSQFLVESVMITFLALIISIGLTDITMPLFNELTGKAYDFSLSSLMDYLPMFMIITISVGVLSGVYPSFFITRFKPADVLKGEKLSTGSFSIRKALVVFQFVMSIVLIITTLVVQNQMSFIGNKDLGFDQSNLIVIDINNGGVRRDFKAIRTEYAKITGVESVGVSSRVPGEWKGINEVGVYITDQEGNLRDSINSYFMGFDEGMIETFDFRIAEGEYFSGNSQSDSLKVLVNQTAIAALGLENPVGRSIQLLTRGRRLSVQVIGVIEDFNFKSLHAKIEPIIIGSWNNPSASIDYFTLKFSGNPSEIVANAKKVHEQFDQRTAMEYHFLDNQLAVFYEKEQQANDIFKAGAGLSILIACLGLFGLASFTVQKRVKEMGIRKVLGASQWNLFYLLSSSFTKQVVVAFLIASPIAFYILRNWLSQFEYRTNIGVEVFLIAGLMATLIALVTVSYRSLKAAHSNPVDSLRSE